MKYMIDILQLSRKGLKGISKIEYQEKLKRFDREPTRMDTSGRTLRRKHRLNTENETKIVEALEALKGVMRVRLLEPEEKDEIIEIEMKEEEKVVWGLCRSFNEGVREALGREKTAAMVIDSSSFQYPYHPHMKIRYRDRVLGEEVSEEEIAELKEKRPNFFIGDDFVLYLDRFPRHPKRREEVRLYYLARPFKIEECNSKVEDCILGVPSAAGDKKMKELLNVETIEPEIGTCLVGYNHT